MSVLFFALILKMMFSLTFEKCTNEFSVCSELLEDDFYKICVNDYYYVIITLNEENEITLDLTRFNDISSYCSDKINILFKNANDANLNLKINDDLGYRNLRFYLNATDLNVIIKSTDSSSDEINLSPFELSFKTIKSEDANRPLKLYLREDSYTKKYPTISASSFLDDIIYISGKYIQLEEQVKKPLTIHNLESISILGAKRLNYTYGKNQIKIEYPDNENIITIVSEKQEYRNTVNIYADENSFITCENGLSRNKYVYPNLISKPTNSISSLPTIGGNWPKYTYNELYDKYFTSQITGKFFYSANNFPLTDFFGDIELVLTQKKSIICIMYDEIRSNFTISSKDDIEASLIFDGEPFDLLVSWTEDWQYADGYLITSPKVTAYASTITGINHMGSGQLVYKNLNNAKDTFMLDSLNLVKGGKIVHSYSFDYNDVYDRIKELYDSYTKETPEDATINYHANNGINFAKDKINDISEIINSASNKIKPLKVSLKDEPDSQRVKSTSFVFNRKDFPISYFYLNSINKPQPILCSDDVMSISDWTFRDASNIFYAHLHHYDEDADDIKPNIPKIANSSMLGEFTLSADKKCIEYKLKEVPVSSFEFFVYTTNDTYIQILEKIDVITLLTSSDLDAASKLKSKNSRNIVIFVLDDVPNGKSINLNGIRKDSNVFVIGMNENKADDIYDRIQKIMDLDDEYRYEQPDGGNWDYEEEERLETEKLKKQVELVSDLSKNYKNYQTKVSLSYNTAQTLVLALVDYTGTHIQCAKFITFLSTFSKINELAKDFYANITYTELVTYKLISSLKLNDLVLFPFTNDPFEVLGIEEINLTQTHWSIKYFSYLEENDGYPNMQVFFYPIETQNVAGKLYLYSGSFDYCALNVPEDKEDQVLKGVSVSVKALEYIKINEIPGIFTLEDNQQNEKAHKKHRKINYFKVFTDLINEIDDQILPKTSKKDNEKATLLENEESVFYFLGNWAKVKSIDHLSVRAGKYKPVYIAKLEDSCNPEMAAKAVNIKTEASVTFLIDIDEKHFTQPEEIKRSKNITFQNENAKVTFSDIIFKTTYHDPEFALMLGEKKGKIITENLILEKEVSATVSCPIEVTKMIELSPYSTIDLDSLTAPNVVLKLNYQISGELPPIPEGFTPKEIIFNYIGEFDNPAGLFDYTQYLGPTNNKIQFTGENHKSECQAWLNKAKFESTYYPEFRADRSTVGVTCIENGDSSMLTINLLKDAIGEKEEPIINVESGPENGGSSDDDDKTPAVPIDDETKRNDKIIDTITDINNKTPEEIENEIIKKFESHQITDTKTDYYVALDSNLPDGFTFSNLKLKENQYVKFADEANVNIANNQMRILLEEDSSKVNINVNDASKVDLSIKNTNDCTVNLKAQGTQNKLSITSNSEVYGHLTFEAENVESIEIESINLHESGSISSTVPLTVNNIEAQPQTTGTLSNVVVSKGLAISQSSALNLDNCNISEASLNLKLHTYTSSNFKKPMLTGTFNNPPKSISLNNPNDGTSPEEKQEFLLFEGTFTSSCDEWKNKIDYRETKFNDGTCQDIDNLAFLEEKRSLKVLYDSSLDKGDNGNKLSGGQIAGIVIGCIAGVAIIVVVVVVVIMKRKKQDSSVESGNDNQNDL